MQTFVVERYLTSWTRAEIVALLDRLDSLVPDFLARSITYVASIMLDLDETCLSVFHGADADDVRRANLELGLPTDRVVAATVSEAHQGDPS